MKLSTQTYLQRNLLLILAREVDKVVIFGTNQEWDGGFIKTTALAIPLLDGVQGALPSEIEHEEDGHGVVTHKRQHVHKLALTTQIPDGKCDFGVANRDGLFHKVDTLMTFG